MSLSTGMARNTATRGCKSRTIAMTVHELPNTPAAAIRMRPTGMAAVKATATRTHMLTTIQLTTANPQALQMTRMITTAASAIC